MSTLSAAGLIEARGLLSRAYEKMDEETGQLGELENGALILLKADVAYVIKRLAALIVFAVDDQA